MGADRLFHGLPRRQKSTRQGCGNGEKRRIEDHAPIQIHVQPDGNGQRELDASRQCRDGISEQETEPCSKQREQRALHQHLLKEAAPACAEREANRDFLTACRGTGEQETSNVHAGDQQHEADDDQEHREEDPDGHHGRFRFEPSNASNWANSQFIAILPLLGKAGVEPVTDGSQSSLGLTEGHAGSETRVHAEHEIVQVAGQVHIRGEAKTEQRSMPFGQDAEHRVSATVEVDGAADDRRIATEVFLPEVVVENDNLVRIVRRPASSVGHGRAKSGEVVLRGNDTEEMPGFGPIVPVDAGFCVFSRHVLKHSALTDEVEHVGLRPRVVADLHIHYRSGIRDGGLAEQKRHRE